MVTVWAGLQGDGPLGLSGRGLPHPLRSSCCAACRDVHLVADKARHRGPRRWEPTQYHVATLVRPPCLQLCRRVQEHCREELLRWAETENTNRSHLHSRLTYPLH